MRPGISTVIAAARRFSSARFLMTDMIPSESAATAKKISALTNVTGLLPTSGVSVERIASIGSDPEIHKTPHDVVASRHPGARAGEYNFRDIDVPNLTVEVRRHGLQDREHRNRQTGENDRGVFAFRREGFDLAAHLEAEP